MLDRFSIALDHIEKKNKLITENSLCKNVLLGKKILLHKNVGLKQQICTRCTLGGKYDCFIRLV